MFRNCTAQDNLQKDRQKLISDLNIKVKYLQLDVTIVFDAQYEASDYSRTHFDSLEIIFTGFGEIADEVILQELKNVTFPHLHTVVTSDKNLLSKAKLLQAQVETVETFIKRINNKYKNKITPRKAILENKKKLEAPIQEKLNLTNKIEEPIQKPNSTATFGECFAYYLDTFEKGYIQEITKSPKSKKKK